MATAARIAADVLATVFLFIGFYLSVVSVFAGSLRNAQSRMLLHS
jgi:hypothetical protein